MAHSNLVKAVVKLKREILRNPVGWPVTYGVSDLATICGAKEEVIGSTLQEMVGAGCIAMKSKPTPNGQTLVTIRCLPAAKNGSCRRVSSVSSSNS
jgi:hypothetical protein